MLSGRSLLLATIFTYQHQQNVNSNCRLSQQYVEPCADDYRQAGTLITRIWKCKPQQSLLLQLV